MLSKSSKQISVGMFIALMLVTVPSYGVANFRVSDYGGGHQIWFEVEDFDQRDPADESSFALSDEPGAFGRTITCMSGTDGASMIRYTFDISPAGGSGGTWYFWGRVINPNNNSSFMLVDGSPGDQVPFTLPVSGLANNQRIFEQSGLGNDWVWAPTPGSAGEDSHTKTLKDGENTMYILAREAGATWDVFMWTDDPDYVPTDEDYQNAKPPALGKASGPNPPDGATDVPRDVVLSWSPGKYAPAINGHVVYLSENFNDVNDGIGGISQSAGSYTPPQRLDFETTYYWRVDEVNAPPSSVVHEGNVWSFTTEPVAYPIPSGSITATASSNDTDKGPENAVNGSGLDGTGLLHGNVGNTMWLSERAGAQPTWIEFEFDRAYRLQEMWVWNSNESLEQVVGLGLKDVTIEYSVDGTEYATLGTTHEFAQAPGTADYAHNTTIDMTGVTAKFIRLTANSNWKGILPQFGLSEVRFFSIPLHAREPNPASGATGVAPEAVLTWRPGREAARHDVSLSTDEQAVIDGTAPVVTVTSPSYSATLDLGSTYYWQITEVNDASTPPTTPGDVWSFSTAEYLVVEDFESYNDIDPPDPGSHRIFESWIDGFGIATNGALVGYDPPQPSYAETAIVHDGAQAMPLFYSNTSGAAFSEVARTFAVPQDWTKHGIKTLGLWFYGTAGNIGQLYVKINSVKIPYDGSAGNLAGAAWQPWNIDLASAGANLQSVSTVAIGVDDNGAAGTLYFDDIRLYAYDRQFVTPVQPDPAGLAAYYPLDGNANDAAGHNGTASAGVSYVPGKSGQAIKLSGYDYVDCGNPSQLNFGTGNWTVAAWINMAPSLTGPNIVFSNGGDDSGGIRYVLSVGQSADHTVTLTVDDNTTKVESIGAAVVDDDQWHHIIGVRDGSSLRIYVDGFQDGADVTLPGGYDLSGTSQANAYIGAGYSFANKIMQKFFTGSIDEVHVYNYALSQAEVAGLAGMTLPFDKPF